MKPWKNIADNLEDYVGFVYKITDLETNEYYLGKKVLWSYRRLKPLKGTKRKRKSRTESNWREYTSSSAPMQRKLAENPDKYEREIIHYCKTKSYLNFLEFRLIWGALIEEKDTLCVNKMLHIRINIDKLKSE